MNRNIVAKFLLCMSAFAAAMPLIAATATVNGIKWSYVTTYPVSSTSSKSAIIFTGNNNAAISTSTSGAIFIPSTLGGYPVSSIGDHAFRDCSGLTSVTIPDSVRNIQSDAFSGCSGLTSVTIGNGVTSIGEKAFYNCSGLTSVTIPDSVTSIGEKAFYNCSGLTSVTIPDGVTSIGEGAFHGCRRLTSITLPFVGSRRGNSGSPDSVFGYIFGTGLYTGGTEARQDYSSDNYMYYYIPTTLKTVTITDESVLGYGAFSGCRGLTSLTIPDSVTSIGERAFYGCSGLTSVTIPDSVTSIGGYAFSGCSGLTSVTIPDSVTSIGYKAFYGCSGLTSVTIPNSVTSVGGGAFSGCSNLRWISLPETCEVEAETIPSETIVEWRQTGVDISYEIVDGEITIIGAAGANDIRIPATICGVPVSGIGERAFETNATLTRVTMSDGIKSIGFYAFRNCSSLEEVSLPSTLTNITTAAFEYCTSLKSIKIPENVENIGTWQFNGCTSLENVTLPSGLKSIPLNGFRGCTALASIEIPGGVTNIDESAFQECSALADVAIPDSVENVWGYAFAGCSSLTNVSFGTGIKLVGYASFAWCRALERIIFYGGEAPYFGSYVFYDIGEGPAIRVRYGATGWGSEIPGTWNGKSIDCIRSLVTFDANGGEGGTSENLPLGLELVAPTVTRTGYTFKGWDKDVAATVPDSDVVYTAQWEINQYTVMFDANGGEGGTSVTQDYGTAIVAPTVTRTGYTFKGWDKDVAATVPDNDVTYTALWEINQYAVTFDANGGVGGTSGKQDYGTAIVAPTVTRTGYTFKGWDKVVAATVPDNDVVYTALWEINQYAVTFDAKGGEGGTSGKQDYGTAIVTPSVTRTGYTFKGWDKDVAATVPDNDVVYTALWEINQYAVTFDANGGEGGTSGKQDYGTAIVAPAVTRTGYAFKGWDKDVAATVPDEDVTYTAQWEINQYTVTFDANGGEGGTSGKQDYGTAIVAPSVTWTGYTFKGWSPSVPSHVPAGDATYTAQWTANNYTVSFAANGGEGEWAQREIAFDSEFGELPVPTRTDYEFVGWFTAPEGGEWVDAATIYATAVDVTLYAHWRCIWQYSVNGDEIEITGAIYGTNYDGELVIPAMIEGLPVTGIGSSAFYGYRSLTSVTIPDSVRSIGSGAFRGCGGLTSVRIPDSVTSIGYDAFYGCSGLTSVTISDSVMSIGYSAFYGCSGLTSVTIPDSVTSWDGAFYNCSSLTSVTIGSGVTSIGSGAFYGCSGLTSVTIPDGVTSIGDDAFSGCSGLTSVTIGNGVTSIGTDAFRYCTSLTSVTIPDSVMSVGSYAFNGCSGLTSITLPFVGSRRGNSGTSDSVFGYIFGGVSYSGGTEIRQYYSSGSSSYFIPTALKTVTITDETVLGYGAFYNCSGLTSVTIGSGVTNIEYVAFYGCSSLTSVTIPDGVTSIGDHAFSGCRGLTSVTIPDGVTTIGDYAFSGCRGLTSAAIPQSGVDSFRQAFGGYGSLSVVLSGAVTNIGDSAFNSCSGLTSVTIPDSVTNIGDLAFGYCSDLTQIIFEGDAPDIGSRAFERVDCTVTVNPWTRGWELAPNATWNGFALKYSTPVVFFDANGGVDVDDPVITDCGAFTNALPSANRTGYTFADWWTEPNGGSRIDESTIIADSCTLYGHWMINKYHVVFNANGGEGATSGELDYNSEIVVPTVTRTGYTFAGWSPDVMERVPAEDVTFTAQWTVNKYRVVFDANGGDGGTNEQIEYATAIAAPIVTRTGYTFFGWDKDVATTVPAEDVTYVAHWTANTYKVSFDVNGGEGAWTQRVLAYDSTFGELPVPSRKYYEFLGWFTELEGGAQIAADSVYSTAGDITLYAHWRCVWEYEENKYGTLTLTAIDPLPEGAVEIPAELEGHAVTALGKGLFNGAEDITQAMIPVTIESLGDWDLRDIEVAGSYEQDGFTIWNGWVLGYDDDTVSYLEVPEGVVGIAPYALSDFEDMEEVVLPESLKYIGCGAFVEDTYLGNTGPVVIPDSVEVIDDEAFKDCSWIRSLTVGGGVRKIGARAFEYIYYLTTLNLPDSLEEIGDNAFINCNNLRSVKLPLELAKVGADPFSGCGNLTGVTVPAGRFTMQQMFPSRYSNIMEAAIIGGTEEICTNAFNGCSSLASVTIPVGVTNICDGAFQNCSRLASVELPETLEAIGASAFRGCSGLSAIVLPDSVSSIGAHIFYGCSNLANITLSRSITTIPDYAFYNCSLLSSIVVPTSVAYIGNYFGNRIYSIYLLCSNAPDYAENAYSYMPDSATTYVQVGSKGWDGNPKSRVIPKTWNERTLTTWTPVQFDATFDANGGTFELTGETSGATQYACLQTKDTSYALPPFDPVWEGHIFDGWWTEQIDGAQITATTRVIEERAVTYYAHWIGDPAEVTVRFNANGGTVEPDENRYYASRPYGQLPVPTREYHRFAGWWTLPQGGSRVVVSTAVPAADQELYAHWTPETYVIRYHANGGSGSMADQYFTYGSTVELRANRFTGKDIASHFVGWAISPDGPAVYADGKTLSTIAAIEDGVINLYAVWSAVQYAVRFDSNGGYGEMANQTLTIGVEEPLDACTFTRMGFDFIGWARVPGGDVVWTNCQSVVNLSSMPESTVVLYAVWNLVSPMPAVATDADVAVVMEGAASSLRANISSLSEYNSYRAWAETRVESQEAAVSSENGWLSFALDAKSVIERELTDGDVSVEKLEPGGNNGECTLEVAIEDVAVGDNATSERLVKAFGLEGSSELDLAKFSGENVSLEAGEPKDGKVKLTVKPKKNTGTFFMRVKLNK